MPNKISPQEKAKTATINSGVTLDHPSFQPMFRQIPVGFLYEQRNECEKKMSRDGGSGL
jgi:hypothetical protein